MDYESKIKGLGIVLPPSPKAVGFYRPVVTVGSLAFLSGQISKTADGKLITGRVGSDLDLEQGKQAAKAAALNVISLIREEIGFNRFERMVQMVGYVQTARDFSDIPQVLNAASELMLEIFQNHGVHARTAVGVSNLPLNVAVELEVKIALKS